MNFLHERCSQHRVRSTSLSADRLRGRKGWGCDGSRAEVKQFSFASRVPCWIFSPSSIDFFYQQSRGRGPERQNWTLPDPLFRSFAWVDGSGPVSNWVECLAFLILPTPKILLHKRTSSQRHPPPPPSAEFHFFSIPKRQIFLTTFEDGLPITREN